MSESKDIEEDIKVSDDEIETKPKREYKPRPPKTQAQLDAFKKAILARDANAKRRREEAEKMLAESKKETEEKVVKKAIAIKKKQIKAQLALEELSDDDEPIEVVKEKVKKSVARPVPKPTFTFV
jgi:predicted carbohydrate-binding protein with CBM5 and CBM33 domain